MDPGFLIAITAIGGTFAIPIVAISLDFRRRKLQFEERRAMIERGMELPPLQDTESDWTRWRGDSAARRGGDPAARRERSLHAGITMLFLGMGLGVAAWLLQNVVDMSFIPRELTGPLSVGAAVVLFLGIGNLVYFVISTKLGGGDAR